MVPSFETCSSARHKVGYRSAGPGPVPRVIESSERAPEPGKAPFRFKIRADGHETRYILAATEAEARAAFLKASGLQRLDPYLSVVKLED